MNEIRILFEGNPEKAKLFQERMVELAAEAAFVVGGIKVEGVLVLHEKSPEIVQQETEDGQN